MCTELSSVEVSLVRRLTKLILPKCPLHMLSSSDNISSMCSRKASYYTGSALRISSSYFALRLSLSGRPSVDESAFCDLKMIFNALNWPIQHCLRIERYYLPFLSNRNQMRDRLVHTLGSGRQIEADLLQLQPTCVSLSVLLFRWSWRRGCIAVDMGRIQLYRIIWMIQESLRHLDGLR